MDCNKKILRQRMRRARLALGDDERRQATLLINRAISPLLRRGKRIAFYWSVGSELSLQMSINKALQRKVDVYLPYIKKNQKRLWFSRFEGKKSIEQQRRHSLNIPQFDHVKIRAHQLHVLLMPLIAIDERGFRLGQGGGFYDITLGQLHHRLSPKKVGVGFMCQKITHIPNEKHDQPLPLFISESGWHYFKKGKSPLFE